MKICPVCKEASFDDAEVCYGCLCPFSSAQSAVLESSGHFQGAQELSAGTQPVSVAGSGVSESWGAHNLTSSIRAERNEPAGEGGQRISRKENELGMSRRPINAATLPDPSIAPAPAKREGASASSAPASVPSTVGLQPSAQRAASAHNNARTEPLAIRGGNEPVSFVLGRGAGNSGSSFRSQTGRWRICLEIALVDDPAPALSQEMLLDEDSAYLMDVE